MSGPPGFRLVCSGSAPLHFWRLRLARLADPRVQLQDLHRQLSAYDTVGAVTHECTGAFPRRAPGARSYGQGRSGTFSRVPHVAEGPRSASKGVAPCEAAPRRLHRAYRSRVEML